MQLKNVKLVMSIIISFPFLVIENILRVLVNGLIHLHNQTNMIVGKILDWGEEIE